MDAVKLEKLFVVLGGLACGQSAVANNFSMAEMVNAPQRTGMPTAAANDPTEDVQEQFAGMAALFRENDLEINHDVIVSVPPKVSMEPVQHVARLYHASAAGFNRMGSETKKLWYGASARLMTANANVRTYLAPKVETFINHAANVLPFKRRQPG